MFLVVSEIFCMIRTKYQLEVAFFRSLSWYFVLHVVGIQSKSGFRFCVQIQSDFLTNILVHRIYFQPLSKLNPYLSLCCCHWVKCKCFHCKNGSRNIFCFCSDFVRISESNLCLYWDKNLLKNGPLMWHSPIFLNLI